MNNQFNSINSIVSAYLLRTEQPESKRYRIWQLAYACIEQLGLDFIGNVKTVKLPIESNATVILPSDYIQYRKIGVINGAGEIATFKVNNKLSSLAAGTQDRLSHLGADIGNGAVFCNYQYQGDTVNVYGVPAKTTYEFKVDTGLNVIILEPSFPYDHIVMEFLATPNPDDDIVVPVQIKEAVIAWVEWKDNSGKRAVNRVGLSLKRDAEHNFYNQLRVAKARLKPFRIEEAYQVHLETQRLCVKV